MATGIEGDVCVFFFFSLWLYSGRCWVCATCCRVDATPYSYYGLVAFRRNEGP